MNRLHQIVLIASTLLASWLGMQFVHEAGHVIGAWLTGSRVTRVVFHPLAISRTDVSPNTHPLFVVWSGPVLGVVLPLLSWFVAHRARLPFAFLLRFFAGFCLLANGLYIAAGSYDRVGDCGEMLRHGSQPWQLWLFGILTAPLGLWLWHGQGQHFGLKKGREEVPAVIAYSMLVVCILLLILGFVAGGETPLLSWSK